MLLTMPRRRAPQVCAVLALVASAGTLHAEVPRVCVESVERGQSLRDQVKLRQARAAFLSCASTTCPAMIQRDCAQWVADIDVRLPTLIVTASDPSGVDLIDVHVLVDGEPFLNLLDGIAVPVDPGIHVFRFESTGRAPYEQQVVVRDAEKYQKLHVALRPLAPPVPPPVAPTAQPIPLPILPERPAGGRRVLSVGTIVVGSTAIVALGTFATVGIVGTVDVHHLNDTCAPNCSHAEADSARLDLRIADVALGVGVLAAAVATYLYFTSPRATAAVGIRRTAAPRWEIQF
jgi:hypothetical protein